MNLINPYVFGTVSFGGGGSGGNFPTIADNNSTFNDECAATTGWTGSNSTVSSDGTYVRSTKTGSGASASKSWTFTPTNQDYILYGKARASVGTNHIAAIWILNGSSEAAIWFGTNAANTTYTANAVSIAGYDGSRHVVTVATGMGFDTTPIEFALQFDFKFTQLNCWFKESGQWVFKGRVACNFFSSTQIQMVHTSGSPNGAWVELDFVTLCSPNIIAIGDSITAGATLYNPNRTAALGDPTSMWERYAIIYGSLRNNLIVNKGVGSQSSATIAARVVADGVDQDARVIILGASSNDETLGVSLSQRMTNIQDAVDDIVAGGLGVVLINGLPGTSGSSDNTPTPDLRDYMVNWWDNYLGGITDLDAYIDISAPLMDSDGFQEASLTQSDGLHPTPTGYQVIGEYIDDFV